MTDAGTPQEAKFKIGDQWYYRGNRSPSWFAVASRPDGTCQDGICERVEQAYWPWLEVIAEVKAKLGEAEKSASEWKYKHDVLADVGAKRIQEEQAKLAASEARGKGMEQDAKRYRWLKTRPATIKFDSDILFTPRGAASPIYVSMIGNTELDIAIDAVAPADKEG